MYYKCMTNLYAMADAGLGSAIDEVSSSSRYHIHIIN